MFNPETVIFEEGSLDYDLGRTLLNEFKKSSAQIKYSKNGRITGIGGTTPKQMYVKGKNTLVVGVRHKLTFESCRPSAHYAIPLVSGCMGMCEYCYLNTQMGKRPYVKIHVNIDEILNAAGKYMDERNPDAIIFEGSATSDPVPVEPYGRALSKTIGYFGKSSNGLFRFVTKYTDIDSILNLKHNGRTTIRFSLNTEKIITQFEHRTPGCKERMEAALKAAQSGYNIGFIIAPVFLYENYKDDYGMLIHEIGESFKGMDIKFEVISHRFTKRAKQNILGIYPKSLLPMEEEMRKFKYGQFGYGKYVYKDDELSDMKAFFRSSISKYFSEESITYII